MNKQLIIIPTFERCKEVVENMSATKLETFIYENSPANKSDELTFRAQLQEVIKEIQDSIVFTNSAPTKDAYELACAALHKHRDRAEKAEAECNQLKMELEQIRAKYLRAAELAVQFYNPGPIPTQEPTDLDWEVAGLQIIIDSAKGL